MASIYFRFSKDGLSWVDDLPTPSKLSFDDEDLDDDSYRSCLNGGVVRTIVGYKWEKVSFEFVGLSDATAANLAQTLKEANEVYLKTNSPMMGDRAIKGYVSKIHFDYIQTGANEGIWSASFNFVEGAR